MVDFSDFGDFADMPPWKSLIKPDDIDVVSPEGEVRSRVKGYYSGTQFVIDDMSVDVRAGDEIRRMLPNGREEAFFVEDPKFYDGGFGKHDQVKISRRGTFDAKTGGNYHVHVSGNNARVNIASTDNSTNTVTETTTFTDMRKVISDGVSDSNHRTTLLAAVDDMEKNQKTPGFVAAYQNFIGVAADHLTLLMPFLPILATLLPG